LAAFPPDVGAMMNQPGFFDVDQRLAAISAKGDPLDTINAAASWEMVVRRSSGLIPTFGTLGFVRR
jgi:hypothetical protein